MNNIIFLVLSTLLIAQCSSKATLGKHVNPKWEGINPAEFVTIGSYTYYFGPPDVQVFVLEARDLCKDVGMNLISFETEQKWMEVKNYMAQNGFADTKYLTSGKNIEGPFYWLSIGEPFTYTNWMEGEPNNPEIIDACVLFTYNSGWYDNSCDITAGFICQNDYEK